MSLLTEVKLSLRTGTVGFLASRDSFVSFSLVERPGQPFWAVLDQCFSLSSFGFDFFQCSPRSNTQCVANLRIRVGKCSLIGLASWDMLLDKPSGGCQLAVVVKTVLGSRFGW